MTEATDEPGYPLRVTRHIAAPPERVWQVMTGQLEDYWCPRPWRTEIVEIDWRSGGRMATIMRGPD
ncbi:SRPBCC domain-containing protein, partial [Erythrobacter donghaensis]